MKEDICSIPVSEVFEPREGCPMCRLRDLLDQRTVEYITGSAMMEPDVRIKTNRFGFCRRHFESMLKAGSRLSSALLLESHLKEVEREIFLSGQKKMPGKKELRRMGELEKDCFVCRQVDWAMGHITETVYQLWMKEMEFRALYREQPLFCLPHARLLMENAPKKMPRKYAEGFIEVTAGIAGRYCAGLRKDVTHFCSMYDYRSRGGDWGNSKDSVERAVQFLTSFPMERGEE